MLRLPRTWRRRLRTVRGQLTLIGIAFSGALALALFLVLNRGFFEQYVREKYPVPAREIADLAARIERGEADAGEVRKLHAAGRAALYHHFMRAPEVQATLPRVAMDADAALFRGRLERTFAAGSRAQKLRAALFAALSGDPRCAAVLRWGLDRARAVGDAGLAGHLEAQIERLSG